MGLPRLFIPALLLRFACACHDPSNEPSLQPYRDLKIENLGAGVVDGNENETVLSLKVVSEVRRKTYYCSTDGTALSCGGSQDPDDECYRTPPDFGPHWGEEVVEQIRITKMTAEQCAGDGTCTTYDVDLSTASSSSSSSSYPAGYPTSYPSSYVPERVAYYHVILPNADACPRIEVEYDSTTMGKGTETFELTGSCRSN